MSDAINLFVNQDSIRAASEEVDIPAKGTKRGELCVIDFYTEMALEGRVYQIHFGIDGAWQTGDQPIASTAAEVALDPTSGVVCLPISLLWAFQTATGTLSEVRMAVVTTASSGGDAYVPQPLFTGGNACRSTARADEVGGVTVTAEANATAKLLYDNVTPIVVAANATPRLGDHWKPVAPCVVNSGYCCYIQVAGTTTAPEYCLSLDFIELPLVNVS